MKLRYKVFTAIVIICGIAGSYFGAGRFLRSAIKHMPIGIVGTDNEVIN